MDRLKLSKKKFSLKREGKTRSIGVLKLSLVIP
jgi:hypothetical protein